MTKRHSALPRTPIFAVPVMGVILAQALTGSAIAAAVAASAPAPDAVASAVAAIAWTDGVVESVEYSGGIVTLRHGEIVNMQMPAMTMTFGVADRTMLAALKAGSRVRFRVELLGNVPTIVRIEPVP